MILLAEKQNSTNVNLFSKYYYFSYILNLICFIIIIFLLFKLYNSKNNKENNKEENNNKWKKYNTKEEENEEEEEYKIINAIVNRIISNVDNLKPLFIHFIIPIRINDIIEEKIDKNDCKIKVLGYKDYYDLQRYKVDNIDNNELNKVINSYIINEKYKEHDINLIKKSLLLLDSDINNFINFNNVNNYNTNNCSCNQSLLKKSHIFKILHYIFKECIDCDIKIIDRLSLNISNLLFHFIKNNENKCIKELFDHIKRNDNDLLIKLLKLNAALQINSN